MGRGFACKYFHEPSDNLSSGALHHCQPRGFSVFERSFPFHVAAFLVPAHMEMHAALCSGWRAGVLARLFVRASVKLYKMFTLARLCCQGSFSCLEFLEKIPLGHFTKAAFSAILHYI